jgi:hypothetical protein
VTVTLGALTLADVRPLARLHRAAFPGFFLSTLGEPFLVQFYRGFLTDDSAVSVVARVPDGSVCGAVVGTAQPADFFGRLVRNRCPGFILASARVVALNPRAAPRLFRAVRYRGDTPTGCRGALLSSLCVVPSLQGAGGRASAGRGVDTRGRWPGVDTAFLTTDAEDNGAVNRFYQAQGWVLSETYVTREGRSMNRYTKRLNVC